MVADHNGISFGSGDAICSEYIHMGSGIYQNHYITRESPHAGQPPVWYVWFAPPYQISVSRAGSQIFVVDHEAIADHLRHPTMEVTVSYLHHALDIPFKLPPSEPEVMANRIKTWITFS